MRTYTVAYRMYSADEVHYTEVTAGSKADAWAAVAMEPQDGEYPYSAWVESVRYSNGKERRFNTSEGNAY